MYTLCIRPLWFPLASCKHYDKMNISAFFGGGYKNWQIRKFLLFKEDFSILFNCVVISKRVDIIEYLVFNRSSKIYIFGKRRKRNNEVIFNLSCRDFHVPRTILRTWLRLLTVYLCRSMQSYLANQRFISKWVDGHFTSKRNGILKLSAKWRKTIDNDDAYFDDHAGSVIKLFENPLNFIKKKMNK